MKIHVIFDFMFLYYKYLFTYNSGGLKRLSAVVNLNGSNTVEDMTMVYYPIREIENIRRKYVDLGNGKNDVTVSVCFDSPSFRKSITESGAEGGSEGAEGAVNDYKGNRTSRITDFDLSRIDLIRQILSMVGYNTYQFRGYEADDLVKWVVDVSKDDYDHCVIVTPDKDLLINIDGATSALRYKSSKGYTFICLENFEKTVSEEFECHIPYNAIDLFLATVGDKSDNIKGITRFGPKAFDKMVKWLTEAKGYTAEKWLSLKTSGGIEETMNILEEDGYLTEEQVRQMRDAYELVKPLDIKAPLPSPEKRDSDESRNEVYSVFGMKSLI